jgi:hypothetical protein
MATTARQRRMLFELADSLLAFTDLGHSGYEGDAARHRQVQALARAEDDLGELPGEARRAIGDVASPSAARMLERAIAGLRAADSDDGEAGLRAVLTALTARLLAAGRRPEAQLAQDALAAPRAIPIVERIVPLPVHAFVPRKKKRNAAGVAAARADAGQHGGAIEA